MKEIAFTEIENLKIGHAQDLEKGSGCTVFICPQGAPTGVDIRGGGPASRETGLLNPLAASDCIHAVLLTGGSAFGLDAAGGVMQYLEERHIGFDVGITKVPLVCASALFDLVVGDPHFRPGKELGYAACISSENDTLEEGNVGAGTGATVGKFHGPNTMMKAGFATYAVQIGDLKVGAAVAVNALGDIIDPDTQQTLAGMLTEDLSDFLNTEKELYKAYQGTKDLFTGNTTLGVIATNGAFTKAQMNKIAGMAQNGYSRTICPVHTTADGDSIYAMSTGLIKADLNVVGTLAAKVMAEAILRAAKKATPAYGLKAWCDFK